MISSMNRPTYITLIYRQGMNDDIHHDDAKFLQEISTCPTTSQGPYSYVNKEVVLSHIHVFDMMFYFSHINMRLYTFHKIGMKNKKYFEESYKDENL